MKALIAIAVALSLTACAGTPSGGINTTYLDASGEVRSIPLERHQRLKRFFEPLQSMSEPCFAIKKFC